MKTLKSRLQALESVTVKAETRTVFYSVIGTVADGWRYDCADHTKGVVMRRADESDDELMTRAGNAARLANPSRSFLALQQVVGD